MKKMLLAAAALAVMASPALAQSRSAYGQTAWQAGLFSRGAPFGIYARGSGYAFQPYGAYSYGRYVGTDPDPSVRLMLLKDAGSENN
jgi:hypothetical protein